MTAAGGHSHADRTAGITTLEHLVEHLAEIVLPSTIVVCVGNELCGDDGAGVAVARALAGGLPWKILDTQTVPESFLMTIVNAEPESVVLIDALDFGAAPGAVELVESDRLGGQGPSTHGPAPLAFLELLNMMHPCRCAVLGIQPQCTEIGTPISQPIAAAVDMVVGAFERLAEGVSDTAAEN